MNSFFLKFGSTACNWEELNEELIRYSAFTTTLSEVFLQFHYMREKYFPFMVRWSHLWKEKKLNASGHFPSVPLTEKQK